MSTNDFWPAQDPLGEALHFLRMTGSFYGRSDLTAPWGLALPPMAGCLWFHVVTSGRAWLDADGADSRELLPGALVLVPHGEGHRLRSGPGVATPPILSLRREIVSDRYEILRHGGGGEPTTLICGAVTFDHPAAQSLVRLLPRIMHAEAPGPSQSEWMQSTLRLIAAESRELRPGGETVITRLADILIIQVIRDWIAHDPSARTGWLGALQDRQIGRAITLIHRDPARDWTVASLASEVAMSRSAFAARFTQLVDEPAMRYVTRWRMQVAVDLLESDRLTVDEVADRLGYGSAAAFSRAFTRATGASPGSVRRNGLARTATDAPGCHHPDALLLSSPDQTH